MDGPPVKDHWERHGLGDAILAALEASGTDLATLTVEDLAPLDQVQAVGWVSRGALRSLAA